MNVNNPSHPNRRQKNSKKRNRKKKGVKHIPFRFTDCTYIIMSVVIMLSIESLLIIFPWYTHIIITGIYVYIVMTFLFMYHLCAIPVGTTLMAVRKGKRKWEINIRHFAFWRLVYHHRKNLPVLYQIISDFEEVSNYFPRGVEIRAKTWIVGRHLKERLQYSGYQVEPIEVGVFIKIGLWPLWQIARLLIGDHKSAGPFGKHRQVYRLSKTL